MSNPLESITAQRLRLLVATSTAPSDCRFVLATTLALIGLLASPAVAQPPPDVSGYDVAWFDDFDGTSLDTSKWDVGDTNVPTNNSVQDYHPNQVSVSGGKLIITSERTNPSDPDHRGWAYKSGLVESDTYQKYGRWEVRARVAVHQGHLACDLVALRRSCQSLAECG